MKTVKWSSFFHSLSELGNTGVAKFGGDFSGADIGIGVIDLLPPPPPPPPKPADTSPVGAEVQPPDGKAGLLAQRDADRKKLAVGAVAAGGVLVLLSALSGPGPTSVPVATMPAPKPGNISIRLDKYFGGKRKRAS